jgi:2-dehydropantoate 2-reductase
MAHLDALDKRFGCSHVLGGQCYIAATLGPEGEILHLNPSHDISFGERDEATSDRVAAIARAMDGAGFSAHASAEILQDMWQKWMFLSALAAGTSLMRASIGDIARSDAGRNFMLGLFDECRSIAEANGFAPRGPYLAQSRATLTASGSTLTASMLRDIEQGRRIEADHIVGDLIRRGPVPPFLLQVALAHLKAYEARQGFV